MNVAGLLDVVVPDPAVSHALASVGSPALDLSGPPGLQPFVIAALANKADRPVLAVTATTREAEDLVDALASLLPADRVADYPAWETLPHERLSPRADTIGRRLAVLRRLRHPDPRDPSTDRVSVVVAPIRSVLQPQVPNLGDLVPVALAPGDEADFDDVVRRLADIAYTRVDMVERRGEFAVRGGILDVFPPTEEHPVRVEFWGDTVEEVRWFKVADQRSLEVAEHGLWAPPCRELLLTDEVRERAADLAKRHPELADMLERIAAGIPVEGMESLAPVLVGELTLLLDELPSGTHVLLCEPERIRTRAADLVRTSGEFLEASWAAAAGGGRAPIDLGAASLRTIAEVREHAQANGIPWWSVSPFTADPDDGEQSIASAARAVDNYRGDTKAALDDVRGWLRDGWRVVFLTEGHGSADRLVEVFRGEDIAARLEPAPNGRTERGVVEVSTGCLQTGLLSDQLRFAVLTEADLAGQRTATKDMRRMPSRRRNTVDPLQLKAGDYVVHEQHGVGRYVDLVQRTVQGATREYLVIEYAPS